jgi:hypothetical protein
MEQVELEGEEGTWREGGKKKLHKVLHQMIISLLAYNTPKEGSKEEFHRITHLRKFGCFCTQRQMDRWIDRTHMGCDAQIYHIKCCLLGPIYPVYYVPQETTQVQKESEG